MMRRRRFRRMLLAHLLREGADEEGEGGEGEDGDEDDESRLLRLLIGRRMMRRRQARRVGRSRILEDVLA
jgi:hypothetical protein